MIVDAAEHVLKLKIGKSLRDLCNFGGDVLLIRIVLRFFRQFDQGLSVVDKNFDLRPTIDPLFFLINLLEDFLRSDVVIPETGRRGLRLQFGYLLFFLV
jgi:hypothetical protein